MGLQVAGGISGAFAAMFNPILAFGALAGGVVAALSLIGSTASNASNGYMDLTSAINSTKAALDRLNGVQISSAVAQSRAAAARQAYLTAQKKTLSLEKQGKDGTKEYTKALSDQLEKLEAYRMAQQDVNRTNAKGTEGTQKRISELRTSTKELRNSIHQMQQFAKMEEEGSRAQKGWIDGIKNAKKTLAGEEAQLARLTGAGRMFNELVVNGMRRGVPISTKFAAAWKNISDNASKAAKVKVANMFEGAPEAAGKTLKVFSDLINRGKGGKASEIVLNPKLNDKQVLSQLKALQKSVNPAVTPKVNKTQATRDIQSLGRGKTATINTKADTRGAERSLRGLSAKKLAARITVRADDRDAIGKLNRVQQIRLANKLVRLGADPKAALAAVRSVEAQKIADKKFKVDSDTSKAENANKKVQGFRDKTVTATTKWAGESEMSAAQSAIAAIQSKTVTVTVNYQSNGSPGRAAGGPTAGAYVPMPAQEKRHAESANRAGTRQSQPGVYRRPTLLVGEENRREWVIAENPSYRGANERYLQDAAANFGYRLTPFDANAATGADFAKKRDGFVKKQSKKDKKGKPRAERHGGYSYDFIQSQISLLSDKSSNLETERNANIERNPDTDPSDINPALSKVLGPLYQIKNKWYDELAYNLKVRSNQAARAATRNSKKLRGKDGLNDKFRDAKRRLQRIRNEKPENEKERKSKDKRLRSAEKQFEKARTARDNARRKVNDRGDSAGALWRELQQVKNDRKALDNRITAIKDNNKSRSEEPGGSDTPFGVQLGALDKSRYDIWQEFAGNVLPGGASSPAGALPGGPLGSPVSSGLPGAGGAAASVSSPSFYASAAGGGMPGAAAAGAGAAAAGAGGGGTTVKQVINISEPPPDPHSFSKQLGWEAAAMLG
jgi:hypothetical protein